MASCIVGLCENSKWSGNNNQANAHPATETGTHRQRNTRAARRAGGGGKHGGSDGRNSLKTKLTKMVTKKSDGLMKYLIFPALAAIAGSVATYLLTLNSPTQPIVEQPKTATASDSSTQTVIQQTNSNVGSVNNENFRDKIINNPSPPITPSAKVKRGDESSGETGGRKGDDIKIESKNNDGIIIGKIGDGNIITNAPQRKLTDEEKKKLIYDLNTVAQENKVDVRRKCIYTIVPQNNKNPKSNPLARDIADFLKKQGYNIQNPAITLTIAGLTSHIEVDYSDNCLRITVLIPEE